MMKAGGTSSRSGTSSLPSRGGTPTLRPQSGLAAPEKPDRLGLIALALFGVALAVRLVHLWQIQASPVSDLLIVDARGYDEWARRIAAGDWLGKGVFYQAPLYPYFLAVVYKLSHGSLLAARVCHAIIGAASCVLLAGAGCRFFSRPVGLLAGLILAFYAPAIFLDGLIQKSVLDSFFLCLVLWLAGGLVFQPRSGLWWWTGLATGCLMLTRENAAVLVVVLLVWLFVHERPLGRRRLVFAGLFLSGLAVILLPVALRNQLVGGEFHLTTSQFGPNFYIGNNENAHGTYVTLRIGRGSPEFERQDATDLAERASGRKLTPAEVSQYWTRRALDYITGHPADWLKLMARKLALTWNGVELADSEDQYTYATWSVPLRLTGYAGHLGVVAPLALLGICLTWQDRSRLWLLYLILAFYAATVVMFYVFGRYRYPLVPILVLFASAGLAGIRPLLRTSPWPRILGCTVLTLAAAAFCNWPILSKTMMQATTLTNMGNVFAQRGQRERAISYYSRALELKPDIAEAYNNRGNVYNGKGACDLAIQDYTRAIELKPDYAEAYYNRGYAYGERHDYDGAIRDFTEAIELKPDYAEAYKNRAIAFYFLKQHDKAWADVKKCRQFGGTPHPDFVKQLMEATGRAE
jgi:tetratricopeptide (TPR) repeat protein